MIKYDGMKAEATVLAYPMLPEGGYVATVKNVKIDGTVPNQTLVIRVDVSEGEQAGYFKKRFDHDNANKNSRFHAKYKGDYRLRIPHEDSDSQYPESDIRRFNDAIWRFEKSNPDFHWDGDETKLIGKTIGINMQAGTYNDSPFTTIGRLEIADDVRRGSCGTMKPRKPAYSRDYQAQKDAEAGFTPVEDDSDVPF